MTGIDFACLAIGGALASFAASALFLGALVAVLDFFDRRDMAAPDHPRVLALTCASLAPQRVLARSEASPLDVFPPCDFGVVDGSPLMAPFLGGLPRQAPNGVTALRRYRRISSDDETSDSVAAEMVPTSPSDLGCVQLFAPLQGCLR